MNFADTLLINAHVLTMDREFHQVNPGAVAVKNNQILEVGPTHEIQEKYQSRNVVDCDGKILMPGLINAHTHVPMTLLRGLADDLRLDVWLMGYMMPVEREFVSPEFVRLGTLLACAEMIQSGVTCFADMYYFEEDIAKATAEAGMRAICAQSVMKFPTPDAQSYDESLKLARAFIEKWKNHPLIIPAVAPHAVYTCTPEILKACAALADEFDVPLHTHISETEQEVQNLRDEEGMPVVPYIKKQGLFDAKVIAAHCVHIDEGEIRTLLHYNVGVAHNPSSNLKLASGFAPVKKMIDAGLNVGIGTDGTASNNDLDMFEEIRLATFLSKGVTGDPTALPARETLLMATRMGAEALHIGDLTGSLEAGKKADLILIDLSPVHNSPQFHRDPNGTYAQIVYAAKATDVTDVMVNGKWLMRDKNLQTIQLQPLLKAAQEYANRIDQFLIDREHSVLSKLIAIGGAMEEESFEIQIKVPITDLSPVREALKKPGIEVIRQRNYRQYDTYFFFEDPNQGRLRYREDDLYENGQVTSVRYRLTLLGPSREDQFPHEVLLSRSRFLAPADQSLRFYREYFKPASEREVEKDRYRYLVKFEGEEFFINLDQMIRPETGKYLEIKSRTWSRQDAEDKAALVTRLVKFLGADPEKAVHTDYIDMKL